MLCPKLAFWTIQFVQSFFFDLFSKTYLFRLAFTLDCALSDSFSFFPYSFARAFQFLASFVNISFSYSFSDYELYTIL
ncbi:TPA: hypothetical protein L6B22_00750 [Pseudomonas aeruginosa]|nr:hypothetical protein IPC1227_31050 [Pseudomonas aeruginosa]HBP5380521.1 hypothetical protein [Pseudomonas aeruginosa]HBP5536353.1 hypothetical protein [Pseudomonas aeruginosa]HBP6812455.1 hypothetical protein [Pseudomonas aeruginosa]